MFVECQPTSGFDMKLPHSSQVHDSLRHMSNSEKIGEGMPTSFMAFLPEYLSRHGSSMSQAHSPNRKTSTHQDTDHLQEQQEQQENYNKYPTT